MGTIQMMRFAMYSIKEDLLTQYVMFYCVATVPKCFSSFKITVIGKDLMVKTWLFYLMLKTHNPKRMTSKKLIKALYALKLRQKQVPVFRGSRTTHMR
jgi:hypothetical protein